MIMRAPGSGARPTATLFMALSAVGCGATWLRPPSEALTDAAKTQRAQAAFHRACRAQHQAERAKGRNTAMSAERAAAHYDEAAAQTQLIEAALPEGYAVNKDCDRDTPWIPRTPLHSGTFTRARGVTHCYWDGVDAIYAWAHASGLPIAVRRLDTTLTVRVHLTQHDGMFVSEWNGDDRPPEHATWWVGDVTDVPKVASGLGWSTYKAAIRQVDCQPLSNAQRSLLRTTTILSLGHAP